MKLNYKRTFFVGFAFLSICAFWQLYDGIVPLVLTNTFGLDKTVTGVIMALDNILALILLPLFGGLSDRTKTRLGKRTPYIIIGTIAAVILMNLLPLFDNFYFSSESKLFFALFIATLGILLIAMGLYRSPAVALMPDVTPKPLRSRANAVINLMGAVGGALYLLLTAVLYPKSKTDAFDHINYQPIFLIVSGIMAIALIILLITIREPKLSEENRLLEAEHPEWDLAVDDGNGNKTLSAPVKKSLGFLLASIVLWFIGYNGVTTWFTTYIANVMGEGIGGASTCLLIGTVGAIVSYIPIGFLAAKIGRKKVILIGTSLLTLCFGAAFFLTAYMDSLNLIMYAVFVIVGFAWAAINVNSLPMVVEMCKGADIGKFTGFYYTASMLAQVLTPVMSGFLLENVSYFTLFPYAAVFVLGSTVTMLFVKHGDVKVEAKKGIEAYDSMAD